MFTKRAAAVIGMGVAGVCSVASAQTIVQGPVYFAGTGHRYYVVQAPTWQAAEAKAISMGGHLATINDAAEGAWIFANLTQGGVRKLFMGLNDAAAEGTFVWANGETSAYRAWGPGEPGNADYVCMQSDGLWYARQESYVPYGVIEIAGPIHVPGELGLNEALSVMDNAIGVRELAIAAGVYQMAEVPTTVNGPRTDTCYLRGEGVGRTVIVGPASQPIATLSGNWVIEGIEFDIRTSLNAHAMRLQNGNYVFNDCVFDGAGGASTGRGVTMENEGSALFSRCAIRNLGAALYLGSSESSCVAMNCEFTRVQSAVIAPTNTLSSFTAWNCTFADIAHPTWRCFQGPDLRTSLTNCVVWRVNVPVSDGHFSARFCDVQGGVVGQGNFAIDPQFVSATDYRLRVDSPCIDAGDTTGYVGGMTDAAGLKRIVDYAAVSNRGRGGAIDLGCYELADPFACSADFNGDGVKNSADFFDFLNAFFTCP